MLDQSMEQKHRDKILDFLRSQKLTVISTAVNSAPQSALVAFVEDDLLCIYFQTGEGTRKAANLRQNTKVSLVFGLALSDMITVQYEGNSIQITETKQLEQCKQLFIKKNSPTTEKYFNHPTSIFFKIIPTWIGYSNYTKETPEVIEVKEFE